MDVNFYNSERMVVLMPERDELFRKFGPILLEAVILVILEEANRIRNKLGMPNLTKQDVLDELNNHLSELEPYDWMEQEY